MSGAGQVRSHPSRGLPPHPPLGVSKVGYESISPLGPDEPPPPPIDPMNPGAGIPLRDDGVDLDELSGSSTSMNEKTKKKKKSTQAKPKEGEASKVEVKKPPMKAQSTKSPAVKPRPPKPPKVSFFFRLGRIIGPILAVIGAAGLAGVLVIFFIL